MPGAIKAIANVLENATFFSMAHSTSLSVSHPQK